MADLIEAPVEAETWFCRWIATVHYRSDTHLIDVTHYLIELEELQDLVERGPHWDTIDRIEIVRADSREQKLTVEQAQKL